MSIDKIIKGGYCVGCGACAAIGGNSLQMSFDKWGLYKPVNFENFDDKQKLSRVCPFGSSLNENDLAEIYCKSTESKYDDRIGYYLSSSAGYVKEHAFRKKGTSGGVITWIATELLSLGYVDHVIHVSQADLDKDHIFSYTISSSENAISNGAKSRYYPVEASGVIKHVQDNPGRYAFVGLPCFIKAIRLIMQEDEQVRNRIKFCIGLVCGHLKSTGFAENFAWQSGINPSNLKYIDFRVKRPGKTAGNYGVNIVSDKKNKSLPTRYFFGSNWGYNFFRNPACNYCDDIFAETADMVVGDAWLDKYTSDDLGTSLVIVRSKVLEKIINNAISNDRLFMNPLTLEEVVESQAGGIRDRREGLSVRLNKKHSDGVWAPKKRVSLNIDLVSSELRQKYLVREKLGNLTHDFWFEAKQSNNLKIFERKMIPELMKYEKKIRVLRAEIKRRLIRFFPFLKDSFY